MSRGVPEEWLQRANEELSKRGLPHIQRPFEAISTWSDYQRREVFFPSDEANEIVRWFEQNSPAKSHQVGAQFTGTYFFDSYFWRVDIPVAFGKVELNALDSIKDLPPLLAKRLSTELPFLNDYVCVWTDTLDYGFGIEDIAHGAHIGPRNDLALQLLRSGDRELRACVDLLTHGRVPNSNAAQSARMATEVFLKAYLVINEGRDERYLQKNFSHDLGKLLLSCLNWKYLREFDFLASRINCFSPVSARYQGTTYPSEMLWLNYSTALLAAVTVVRSLSGRDSRPQMKPNP